MMKKSAYEIRERDFGDLLIQNKEEEHRTRKSKRYGVVKRINVEFTDHSSMKKEQKVKLQNISRTGALIYSRYYLEDEITIKLSENVKVESKIVRRGIVEEDNIYYYGISYNEPFSPSTFNGLMKEEMPYDFERCCSN